MNLKEATKLIGFSIEKVLILIREGIMLNDGTSLRLEAEKIGNNKFDITDENLDAFFERLESNEPGRHPSVAIRRTLLIETGYKCAVCRSDAPLQFHHILGWNVIKNHDPDHMLAICGVCHDKITRQGEPDVIAQKQIKAKISEKIDTIPAGATRAVPITNPPLCQCDEEIVDQKDKPRIIWLLPRGFIILDDVEWNENETWSVTADYYHYGEGWRQGTHYHDGYGKEWNNRTQYRKLGIPIGDWEYCIAPLNLMCRIRDTRITTLEETILKKQEAGEPVLYFQPGQAIVPAELPRNEGKKDIYVQDPEFRDLSAEMRQYCLTNLNKKLDLQHAHDHAAIIRIRAISTVNRLLGKEHPVFEYFIEVAREYDKKMDGEQLKDWLSRFNRLFLECYQMMR